MSKSFSEYLESKKLGLENLQPIHVKEFIYQQKAMNSKATYQRFLAALFRFVGRTDLLEYIKNNMREVRSEEKFAVDLTLQEVQRLIDVTDQLELKLASARGISLGLDTLKYTSINADIRAVVDYFIFKSQGTRGFPDDMRWWYGYWNPAKVRWSKPQYFFIVSAKGALGIGKFLYPFWHKEEREDILRSVGLKVEHGDEIDYGQNLGAYKTVGDQEHLDIIEGYLTEGLSKGKLAKKLDRSAATIHAQIHAHNKSIDKMGYCAECRRLKGMNEMRKTSTQRLVIRVSSSVSMC